MLKSMSRGVLSRYRDHLPVGDGTPMITLGEGETPLVASSKLSRELDCPEVYFKLEGCNPTGSFKDRGMVVAVAKALEAGSRGLICASTGNTSAAAAAYGAHFNIPATVLVPKGDVASGKLAQARAYGARILVVEGNFDKALALVRAVADRQSLTLVNSVNPYRLEGQKTASFELVDELGDAPDILCLPVGNAGNITAYWKGFVEYHSVKKARSLPRMMGFQALGASPIVQGHLVDKPDTVASAIRIGNPAGWEGALKARDESGGVIEAVGDDEILDAYRFMAAEEGIFCEPASAACVAGLRKLHQEGFDLTNRRVVCVLTGSGLKDPELAARFVDTDLVEVGPTLEEVEEALLMPTS